MTISQSYNKKNHNSKGKLFPFNPSLFILIYMFVVTYFVSVFYYFLPVWGSNSGVGTTGSFIHVLWE